MPDDEPLKKTVNESAAPVTKTAAELTDAQGMPSVLPPADESLKKTAES